MNIHEAATTGNLNRVRALLNQGVPVNSRDNNGNTPLHFAARHGHLNIVHELLRHGARVNPRDKLGLTPLHWAAFRHYPHLIHVLLKAGANPKNRNRYGSTPYNHIYMKSARNALRTSRAATKWLETTRKRRQKVASLMALRPLPLNIKRRILSNAGLKKKSP